MRIRDQLDAGPLCLSFEFFPPKDEIGFWDLYRTIESLKPLAPAFVSVTYGAGGGTRRKTVDLVGRIKSQLGIEPMAHLTCVGSDRDEIARVLDQLMALNIENVLALRGDPPKGDTEFRATEGGFQYASELVAYMRARGDGCSIGAACYPEGHPEANSLDTDLDNLKRKVDAGVDFLITQLFFDNADFYRFRERANQAGIDVPIVAGIMPILGVSQVKRFTKMCGAAIPAELLGKIEAVEDDAEAVRQLGMYHATEQCLDLADNDIPGIHFYTLNRSTATRAICQQVRANAGRPATPTSDLA